ncbi:MAG: YhjD/YihY/BrkB family envelope integrity protein [Myxococcota bacterium]|nr:YhjD/YihY/BrkB family envelope integrity protein [Myxococcota bacterium]
MATANEQLTEIRSYLSDGLWRQELEPGTWAGRGARLLQFAIMVGEGFVRDQLLLRASALTYFTVLAIVPLLAIVSAVAAAVGVTENVVGPIIDQFSAVAPQVGENIRSFVTNANFGALGTLGAATLFLTTVLGISNIERSLNHIWGVQQERSWARRLPDYLAVLIVAPLILGVGLSLATTVKSQWIVQKLLEFPVFELAYDLGLRQLPTLVLAGGFAFLYWFLPNTSVRPFAALLAGIVAAIAVNAALALYVGFSVGVARADALYGGFAQLPLFFVWTYVFWAVVLFGAEIAFAYQNLGLYVREVRGEAAGPAEREAIGLRIALEIARSFRDGQPPWTEDGLSEGLRVPVRTVRDVLVPLQRARIVASVEELDGGGSGWQLGRPAEAIHVVDVLAALRGAREPVAGDADVTGAVESLLTTLRAGEIKAAAGQSLADVLVRIPEVSRPAKV